MLEEIILYGMIFLLSMIPWIESSFTVPIAIIVGANPILSFIVGIIGNTIALAIIILFSEKMKNWIMKDKESKRGTRAKRIMEKYGVVGLSVLGPLTIGSHFTAMVAISLHLSKVKTFLYTVFGTTLWTVIFSALVWFGVDWFNIGEDSFVKELLSSNEAE